LDTRLGIGEWNLEPYWWDAVSRPVLPEVTLPKRIDVAIIGSGYTGLSAALTLVRADRSVVVFDKEAAGWGGSSRNQGHVGLTRQSLGDLERLYGTTKAVALLRESAEAIEFTISLIEREGIQCLLRRSGRFIAAARPGHYEKLARNMEARKRAIGFEATMVPRAEAIHEVASEEFYGGEVRVSEACLHGALFHAGLLERVRAAGATVAVRTPVARIERTTDGFRVRSFRGAVAAKDVVIATDGLIDGVVPGLRRRVIPVSAGGIATEPISPDRMKTVLPSLRPCIDTRKLSHSVRPSPDMTRIIFGGRATMLDTDPRVSGQRLYRNMVRLFPQLEGIRLTHSWLGTLGYTFQGMAHIGVHDGLHYALGYCGHGVADAPYLGHKVALRILRANDAATAYDDLPFETRPLYSGRPWFLPATVFYYRCMDALSR
jgi:glycine/D-amino acid oxidase-like deaminating enzyme